MTSPNLTTMDIATAIRDALVVQDQVERSDCQMVSIEVSLDQSTLHIIASTDEEFRVVVTRIG